MDTTHPAADSHAADGHATQSHAKVNYMLIFGYLCICTAIAVGIDFLGGKPGEHGAAPATGTRAAVIFLVMSVAVVKALLVINYFMHVKFEGKWILAMLLPTTVLALFLPAALTPDIALSYYSNRAPQIEAYHDQVTGDMSTHHDGTKPVHAAPLDDKPVDHAAPGPGGAGHAAQPAADNHPEHKTGDAAKKAAHP